MNDITNAMPRKESMRILREGNVPDALIGAAFGVSGQRVNAILGPHQKRIADPLNPPDDFPEFLRLWRIRNGKSQAAGAEAIGIKTNTWAHWEQGQVACSLPATVMLCLSLIEGKTTKPKR